MSSSMVVDIVGKNDDTDIITHNTHSQDVSNSKDSEYRAKRNAYMREYRRTHPEYKKYTKTPEYLAKQREHNRKWRERNHDKIKDYRSTEKYKDAQRERSRRWYSALTGDQRAELSRKSSEYSKSLWKLITRYKNDPEYAKSLTEAERLRMESIITRSADYRKNYYRKHKEHMYAKYREWVAKNPERRRELALQSYHRCKHKHQQVTKELRDEL